MADSVLLKEQEVVTIATQLEKEMIETNNACIETLAETESSYEIRISKLESDFSNAVEKMTEAFAIKAEAERCRIGELFGNKLIQLTKEVLDMKKQVAENSQKVQDILILGPKIRCIADLSNMISEATEVAKGNQSIIEKMLEIEDEILKARNEIFSALLNVENTEITDKDLM